MARKSPYNTFDKRGVAYLDTTIAGVRIKRSLGVSSSDTKQVREAASLLYQQLIAGRSRPNATSRVTTEATMGELVDAFIESAKVTHPRSWRTLESHCVRLLDTALADLLADDGPRKHGLARLARVTRQTMLRELTSVRSFFRWALEAGHIRELPPAPSFPKGLAGTRSGPQREHVVEVTHEEALAIIAKLPRWQVARRTDANPFRVRDRVRFMYEMGMRPSMVARLEVPRHWRPGAKALTITADIDKVQFGRELPLTAAALDVLVRCAPKAGLIFGDHGIRRTLKKAAATVLDPERAKGFARYDFRHARGTDGLAKSGNNILGVGYLLGHKRPTTTNRYTHAAKAHADALVKELDKGTTGW